MANRENVNVTLLASAARTATNATGVQINPGKQAVDIIIDATAASATPSVVFTVQGLDPLSGQYYTILASSAVTGISTTVLRIGPGLTAAANTVANYNLPRHWRVNCVHADANSITYSIGAQITG